MDKYELHCTAGIKECTTITGRSILLKIIIARIELYTEQLNTTSDVSLIAELYGDIPEMVAGEYYKVEWDGHEVLMLLEQIIGRKVWFIA